MLCFKSLLGGERDGAAVDVMQRLGPLHGARVPLVIVLYSQDDAAIAHEQ